MLMTKNIRMIWQWYVHTICTQSPKWKLRNTIKIPQLAMLQLNILNHNCSHPSYPVWNKISGDRWTLSSQPSCLNLVERLWIPNEASLRATAWQVNLRWLANVLLSLDYIMSCLIYIPWSHGLPSITQQTSAICSINKQPATKSSQSWDSHPNSPNLKSACHRSWELSHQHGWFNCGHCSTEVTLALAFDHCFCCCSTEQPCSCSHTTANTRCLAVLAIMSSSEPFGFQVSMV